MRSTICLKDVSVDLKLPQKWLTSTQTFDLDLNMTAPSHSSYVLLHPAQPLMMENRSLLPLEM